ncbi:MAG TPA: hypothetical protein PLZ57_16310 [Pseudobdellovibrionaceae bacterium]|nr:hypothetical protein [Pseudobdellovibrionaceae bacterium]
MGRTFKSLKLGCFVREVRRRTLVFNSPWRQLGVGTLLLLFSFPALACGYDATTQIFTTPGGRQIHILAQEHAHPGDPLLNTLMTSAEPAELAPAIRSWIARNGGLIQATSQARGRIRELLQQRRLNWLAIELGPDEVSVTHDELFRELDQLQRRLRRAGLNDTEIMTFITASAGPHMATLWELRDRRARMIGVDDSKLREEFLRHVVEVQRGIWDARDLARSRGDSARASAQKAVDELDAYVGYGAVLVKPMNADRDRQVLAGFRDAEARRKAEEVVRAGRSAAEVFRRRDDVIADRLLGTEGHGLLVVGSHHGPGVMRRLQSSCEAQAAGAARAPGAPGSMPAGAPSGRTAPAGTHR